MVTVCVNGFCTNLIESSRKKIFACRFMKQLLFVSISYLHIPSKLTTICKKCFVFQILCLVMNK